MSIPMYSYTERCKLMEGKTPEELYLTGLKIYGEGESWEALQWFNESAKQGNIDALFNAGQIRASMLNILEGTDEYSDEIDEIIDIFTEASDKGHKNAGIMAANLLMTKANLLFEEDEDADISDLAEDALCSLEDAYENGNDEALYFIAQFYESGCYDNPANMFSDQYYLKAAQAGIYGGYLGLSRIPGHMGVSEGEIKAKLEELSPYPPTDD